MSLLPPLVWLMRTLSTIGLFVCFYKVGWWLLCCHGLVNMMFVILTPSALNIISLLLLIIDIYKAFVESTQPSETVHQDYRLTPLCQHNFDHNSFAKVCQHNTGTILIKRAMCNTTVKWTQHSLLFHFNLKYMVNLGPGHNNEVVGHEERYA